jgi:hypothetical protein
LVGLLLWLYLLISHKPNQTTILQNALLRKARGKRVSRAKHAKRCFYGFGFAGVGVFPSLPLKPIHSPALDWAAADAFVVTGEYSGRSPSAPLLPRRQPLSSSPTSFLHSPLALKELGANDGPKQELKRIDRPPQELDQDSIRLSNLLIMQIESWLEVGRDKQMGPARFRREIDIV